MNNTTGTTVNGTETINLKNALLVTIINSGREKIDRLQRSIDLKNGLICQLEEYPQQFVKDVEQSIELNMNDVREIANESLQSLINSITDTSDQQIQVHLRQKSELAAMETEMKIQEDVLKSSIQKREKCVSQLQLILKDVTERLKNMKSEYYVVN